MASQNVFFETIPSSIRVPGRYIEFNTKLAVRGLPTNAQQVLIVAPMLTGTQAPLTPVMLFSDTEAAELFGAGSFAHRMTRQAIRNNQYINLSVIGIPDDAAAIKATGKIEGTGTATREGQLILKIAGDDYRIAVSRGEAVKDICERLAAVINADEDAFVVAKATATNITFTAKNGGEIGNTISLIGESNTPGITFKIGAMENGQGNTDVSDALSIVAGKHYQIYISAFSDDENLSRLSEHIDNVSNAIEKRGGVVVAGFAGTFAGGVTKTSKLNNERVMLKWYKGSTMPEAMIAAGFGAVMAFEEDPARPLNTLEVKGLDVTPESQWPTFTEFNNALYNGLSPLHVVNNRVQVMRAITTYTKNATGTDDPALLDVTTIRILDYTLKSLDQRWALRFPNDKMIKDKTPIKVRSETLDVLLILDDLEILQRVEANKSLLISEADMAGDGVRLAIPAEVVQGLHKIMGRIDLYL